MGRFQFSIRLDTFRHMVACSPFGPAGEFAASRHGALTRSQAATFGLTDTVIRRLLRDDVIREPVPGVLVVTGSPTTWHQRMLVATLASRAAGAAGFRSAAALHGIDGFTFGPLDLLLPAARHITLPLLTMHRGPFDHIDLSHVDGIRCTSIARTLCDLGGTVPVPQVKVALEWAWRTHVSLAWLHSTAKRLDRPGRRGPAIVLSLLEQIAEHQRPTESALEVRIEAALAAVPGLVRQYEVRRADGTFVARVDFAIPALKVAIEAHSRRFHFGIDHEESDAQREAELHAEGWIVRYITDAQRRDPVRLRTSILQLVDARLRSTAA
jgi:very-short-patch-repair endonuclease